MVGSAPHCHRRDSKRLRQHRPDRYDPEKFEGTEMILSCGEALIDMLPRTTTLGEPAFSPYAGGAVFNTAIALGRLGARAGFFSGLSTDMLGDILTETLKRPKLTRRCARVRPDPRRSRL